MKCNYFSTVFKAIFFFRKLNRTNEYVKFHRYIKSFELPCISRQSSTSVNRILCSGTETSFSKCNYTLGTCSKHQEHANLLCRHESVAPGNFASF